MIEPKPEPARVYNEESKNVRNVPDEIILRRLKLYQRIEIENLARQSACRHELESRFPEITNILRKDEVIEDALEIRKPISK
jgi:hypothetical protein